MRRAARVAAVVAPILGLAGLWVASDRTYHSGTEWEVPIQGYDPRDYLRGHYVEFTYDWPGFEENRVVEPQSVCLEGEPPLIVRVRELREGQGCAHPIIADPSQIYGTDAVRCGRLYVGQDRAAALEQQLRDRDQRGIVTLRQREDGSFTPIDIRFRPLTAQEIAERDRRDAIGDGVRVPPPIMAEP